MGNVRFRGTCRNKQRALRCPVLKSDLDPSLPVPMTKITPAASGADGHTGIPTERTKLTPADAAGLKPHHSQRQTRQPSGAFRSSLFRRADQRGPKVNGQFFR